MNAAERRFGRMAEFLDHWGSRTYALMRLTPSCATMVPLPFKRGFTARD